MKKLLSLLIIPMVLLGCANKPETGDSMEKMEKEESAQVQTTTENQVAAETGNVMKEEQSGEKLELVTTESTLTYSAKKVVGAPHVGTVAISEGYLMQDGNTFTGGKFVIDMTQITEENNNEGFLKHIKADDFFAVETYPTSTIEITSISDGDEGTHVVTGNLTIKDKTNPITFDAVMTEDDQFIMADAEFNIDRTRWGINFNSGSILKDLGDKAIEDEIYYTLNLKFKK